MVSTKSTGRTLWREAIRAYVCVCSVSGATPRNLVLGGSMAQTRSHASPYNTSYYVERYRIGRTHVRVRGPCLSTIQDSFRGTIVCWLYLNNIFGTIELNHGVSTLVTVAMPAGDSRAQYCLGATQPPTILGLKF